jgi:hypothetical protein
LTRLAERTFSKADRDKSGSINLHEFLESYKDIFSQERKQVAIILQPDFPGWSLEQIESALEKFEKYDLDKSGILDRDEFYQLKEEILGPKFSKLLLRYATDDVLKKADKDNTGALSEQEFLDAFSDIFSAKVDNTAKVSVSSTAAFNEFVTADTLEAIMNRFAELKEALGWKTGDDLYTLLKNQTKSDARVNVLWRLLDTKKAKPDYKPNVFLSQSRALVVGAGPGGLRTAVELLLLGMKVTIVERRRKFSRNNLLHLWPASIRDLTNIGAKYFYPKFCVGGINHCAIRKLQGLLLKIALILGADVLVNVQFKGIKPQAEKSATGRFVWTADVEGRANQQIDQNIIKLTHFIGSDGANSAIATQLHYDRKVFQGSQAIGITANFVNEGTKAEQSLNEFGLMSVYNQKYFSDLEAKQNVVLENLVYYRGETHYFVMTAKKQNLIANGVLKADFQQPSDLLGRNNVEVKQLEEFVRRVAKHVGLPDTAKFADQGQGGAKDVAIFDFSKKQESGQNFKFLEFDANGTKVKLFTALAGDALVEPFWPQGTGANRAVLSALDTAWTIKKFAELSANQPNVIDQGPQVDALTKALQKNYRIMVAAAPEDLQDNFSLHSLDPNTRYKKRF